MNTNIVYELRYYNEKLKLLERFNNKRKAMKSFKEFNIDVPISLLKLEIQTYEKEEVIANIKEIKRKNYQRNFDLKKGAKI